MLKTTLSWTMHINTDKRRFEDALYKEIKYRNSFHSFEHSAHYEGRMFSESSFFISKQESYNKVDRLNGKIIEDAEGLLVELELRPSFHRVGFYTATFVFSVLACYGIGGLISDLIQDFFLLSIGVMLLPVFLGILWLAQKVRRITDLGSKAIFIDMLADIEKQAL
ncbi:hypothetical protein [Niastella sp. OAS944]|uniref:hypothetical protein n=1 Tax=Niastella sp. OAS944 TaxID=2664089 RepID=UPI0034760842|nr:hypothetical protein [Chitinophagaceae bacterium OAS944]